MGWFRLSKPVERISLCGPRVELRTPNISDFQAWASLREQSRQFLAPWEPLWPKNDLTRSAFRARLRRYWLEQSEDRTYPFFIVRTEDQALVGGLTFTNVRRGVANAATLGYWMGVPFAGQGYMSAAVRLVIPYLFGELKLNRIEAACLLTNVASIRLLERTRFQKEGLARSYLCIAGKWQDHLLYATLARDWLQPDASLSVETRNV